MGIFDFLLTSKNVYMPLDLSLFCLVLFAQSAAVGGSVVGVVGPF